MFTKDKQPDYEIGGVLHRVCDTCQTPKPLEQDYYLCSNGKARRHKCRGCLNSERLERQKNNPRTAEQKRISRIRKIYGLRPEEFDLMWSEQDGLCKICSVPLTVDKKNTEANVNIDHCHDSNLVRGLLCSRCNRGLGQFLDDQKILAKAIAYLDGPFLKTKGLLTNEERGDMIRGKKLPRR